MSTVRVMLTLTLLIILVASAQAATGNLIVNGSFEQSSLPQPSSSRTLPSGSTDLTGWTVTGVGAGGVDWNGGYWQASDGYCSIDLNSTQPGGLKQTVATTPGLEYTLLFDMAGNPDPGTAVKVLAVLLDDVEKRTFTFDKTGSTRGNMRWSNRQLKFTASSTSTTIEFQSRSMGPLGTDDAGRGPALDNVRLYRPNAIPTAPTSISLNPAHPVSGKNLTATAAGATDADGDEITYEFAWERSLDGGKSWYFGPSGSVLSGSRTRHDQLWRCRVRARDWQQASGWVTSGNVLIRNGAPTKPTVATVFPVAPKAGQRLMGRSNGATDPDHDPLTRQWQWWKSADGSLWERGPAGQILSAGVTVEGEYWEVAVRVTDGSLYSAWTFSNPVTIGAARTMTVSAGAFTRGALTQIAVNLSASAQVQATVRNVAGRTVATLPAKTLEAGLGTLLWNGRSDSGTKAPAGQYMVTVEAITGDGQQARCVASLQR